MVVVVAVVVVLAALGSGGSAGKGGILVSLHLASQLPVWVSVGAAVNIVILRCAGYLSCWERRHCRLGTLG